MSWCLGTSRSSRDPFPYVEELSSSFDIDVLTFVYLEYTYSDTTYMSKDTTELFLQAVGISSVECHLSSSRVMFILLLLQNVHMHCLCVHSLTRYVEKKIEKL